MLSERLKKRFCKDMNLSITVFDEPYFTDRIELYGMSETYSQFESMIANDFGGNEEAYFEYYGKIKDAAIDYIKTPNGTFDTLNKADMNALSYKGVPVSNKTNHPDRDIYKEGLVGRYFISIDMRKANFSALVAYGQEVGVPFIPEYKNDNRDYVRFLQQFTDNALIIKSKYIRQVIFGNCNPKRQIHYEKCLMLYLLNKLEDDNIIKDTDVFSVHNDEIILTGDSFTTVGDRLKLFNYLDDFSAANFPLKAEYFQLGRIRGSKAYIKRIEDVNDYGYEKDDPVFEPKCVSPDEMPFVYRTLKGLDYTSNDYVFVHDGKLARFLDIPKMEVSFEPTIEVKKPDDDSQDE